MSDLSLYFSSDHRSQLRSQLVLAELGRSADMIKNYGANEKFGNAVQPQFPGAKTYLNRSRNRQRGNNNNIFDRRDSTNDNNVFDRHVSNNTNRPTYSNPNIPFGVRAFSENQHPKTCRAHIYFGPAAKTCKPWCWMKNHQNVEHVATSSRPPSPSPHSKSPN